MKAALVVVSCVVVAYFATGTAQSGAQTVKAHNARAAAIEAAVQ